MTVASNRDDDPGLRYLRVANTLKRRIVDGVYKPGDCLPRQHDFAKELNVSWSTLRRSVELLRQEGYLIGKPGQGTFVSLPEDHAPIEGDFPLKRKRLTEESPSDVFSGRDA